MILLNLFWRVCNILKYTCYKIEMELEGESYFDPRLCTVVYKEGGKYDSHKEGVVTK